MIKWKRLLPLLWLLFFVPWIYLFLVAGNYGFFGDWKEDCAQAIDKVYVGEENLEEISLPHTFSKENGTKKVVLSQTVYDVAYKRMYIKSVYAPFCVYADDELLYEYGREESYPHYLKDPPVQVIMLVMPEKDKIDLRLEYEFPSTRDDLKIEPPLVGTYASIFAALLEQQERFSILFIFFFGFGLLLLCAGAFICTFEPQGKSFIWLGFITLLCSLWGFGECDISGLFIHNEGLLYLFGFTGVYYLPAAVQYYFRSTVSYKNPKPITICARVCFAFAVGSTILQALSISSFYSTLPYFITLAVFAFVFGIGYTIYEWRENENPMAKLFLLPWIIVMIASIVEGGFYWQENGNANGFFSQFALLVFILANSIIGGMLTRKTLALKAANRQMEQEYKLMEIQVNGQQKYQGLLMETRQTLRQQRHDLRHQLAAIRGLAQEGDFSKLNAHLDSLIGEIPEGQKIYCENIAVNTVVSYYAAKAKEIGIDVDIKIIVPELTEKISHTNICMIFGNIMENAIEACERMSSGERFIKLTSNIRNEFLVINQKNSFDGSIHKDGDKFYSSKRDEFGIGLSSVMSVAQKHGGDANFRTEEKVFCSEIYTEI